MRGTGGGRQSLKHIHGDVPMCMRNEDKDVEMKSKEIGRSRGEGGGRHRYRHAEGDLPICMRREVEKSEVKSKENRSAAA